MTFLGRKLESLAKWEARLPGLVGDEVGASAVTCDLRDTENKLSFWGFDDVATVSEVALAITSVWRRADRCVTAWIDREDLVRAGIRLENSKGETLVFDFTGTHVDAIELDGKRLLVIADSIAVAVRSAGRFRQFTKAEVVEILAQGVSAERLRLEDLKGDLLVEVRAKLGR